MPSRCGTRSTALLPRAATKFDPTHPLGCHRLRVPDRIIFDKLLAVLVFGCSYVMIADATCSATTLRRRRDEWITAGVFAALERLVRDSYDRMIGLALADVSVDGCVTKAPGGGQIAGRSPVDRGKQGMKRSTATDAHGIPLGTVTAPPTAMTRRCWAPPSTSSTDCGGCPTTSPCTWTAATTRP